MNADKTIWTEVRGELIGVITKLDCAIREAEIKALDPQPRVAFAWELGVDGRIVTLHNTYIDESLRGNGVLGEYDGFKVKSISYPLPINTVIYLQGNNPTKDNYKSPRTFPTHAEAVAYRNRAQAALEHVRDEIQARWEAEAEPEVPHTCSTCANWHGDETPAKTFAKCDMLSFHCPPAVFACGLWKAPPQPVEAAAASDEIEEGARIFAEQQARDVAVAAFAERWGRITGGTVTYHEYADGTGGWCQVAHTRVIIRMGDDAEAKMRAWFEGHVATLSIDEMGAIWKERQGAGESKRHPGWVIWAGSYVAQTVRFEATIYLTTAISIVGASDISPTDAYRKAHILACIAWAEKQVTG